jgi:hypothetical protein
MLGRIEAIVFLTPLRPATWMQLLVFQSGERMDRHQDPQVEKAGRILKFPLLRSKRAAAANEAAKISEARVLDHRRRRITAWISGVWILLAWTVAACQLRLPVLHHQVFGAETIAAFLVVVLMPIVQAGKIASAARRAVVVLRRATSDRRGAEPKGAEPHPPALPPTGSGPLLS